MLKQFLAPNLTYCSCPLLSALSFLLNILKWMYPLTYALTAPEPKRPLPMHRPTNAPKSHSCGLSPILRKQWQMESLVCPGYEYTMTWVCHSCHRHTCASLQRLPSSLISQLSEDPLGVVGVFFAADFIGRYLQFSLRLRENTPSYTVSCH